MKSIALIATLVLAASCSSGNTDAEQRAAVGDLTTCHRTQWPVPCPVSIECSSPVEACLAAGCWIAGGDLYLYPDGSWRSPDPGPGAWSLEVAGGVKTIHLGSGADLVVNDSGISTCP